MEKSNAGGRTVNILRKLKSKGTWVQRQHHAHPPEKNQNNPANSLWSHVSVILLIHVTICSNSRM